MIVILPSSTISTVSCTSGSSKPKLSVLSFQSLVSSRSDALLSGRFGYAEVATGTLNAYGRLGVLHEYVLSERRMARITGAYPDDLDLLTEGAVEAGVFGSKSDALRALVNTSTSTGTSALLLQLPSTNTNDHAR